MLESSTTVVLELLLAASKFYPCIDHSRAESERSI